MEDIFINRLNNIDTKINFVQNFIITILFKECCEKFHIYNYDNYKCIKSYFSHDIKEFEFKNDINDIIELYYLNDDDFGFESFKLNNLEIQGYKSILQDFEEKINKKFFDYIETKIFNTNDKLLNKMGELLKEKEIYNCEMINYILNKYNYYLYDRNDNNFSLHMIDYFICINCDYDIWTDYDYDIKLTFENIITKEKLFFIHYCSSLGYGNGEKFELNNESTHYFIKNEDLTNYLFYINYKINGLKKFNKTKEL